MPSYQEFVLRPADHSQKALSFGLSPTGMLHVAGGKPAKIQLLRLDPCGMMTLLWGDRIVSGMVSRSGETGELLVTLAGVTHRLSLREAAVDAMEQTLAAGQKSSGLIEIRSPIPGLIKAIRIQKGDKVSAGQTLIVLEAMKMENEIVAPHAGAVTSIVAAVGQTVAAGVPLASIQA